MGLRTSQSGVSLEVDENLALPDLKERLTGLSTAASFFSHLYVKGRISGLIMLKGCVFPWPSVMLFDDPTRRPAFYNPYDFHVSD